MSLAHTATVHGSILVKHVFSCLKSKRSSSSDLEGWFEGLSSRFLTTRTARLLVLAGTDRLDNELMIGQMQGKFQLVVVPDVGHMLQEVRTFPTPYFLMANILTYDFSRMTQLDSQRY